MRYYPVVLDLQNRPVLVVGGGPVAERKVISLLEAGARVRVVSPNLTARLRQMVDQGEIAHRPGRFRETDLDGVCLVIGATDDVEANARIARAAERRRLFCNIVDAPSLSSFIAPAVITRGDILIAISTSGQSPALAIRLKREIAALIGQEYARLAELLGRWRSQIMRSIPNQRLRARLFHRLVESDILELLRAGCPSEAERRARQLIERAARESEPPPS
ncbi:MAG: bifunctional precorrin-2 dehydrogenase/sirohydrochlorin ferrochelatase [Acidobacteria bacterium]|nr:MAG: bifunctional precorrin-2 dehydrogenase/sirohydrochlorin ferrochelatase [Acidobacteriota bacterium]